MPLIIVGLIFIAVTAFVMVGLFTVFSEERKVTRALRNVSAWEGAQAATAEPLLKPFRHRVFAPGLQAMAAGLSSLVPGESGRKLQHRLELAGNPGKLTVEGFQTLRLVCGVAGFLLSALVVLVAGSGLNLMPVVAVLAIAGASTFAPDLWLYEAQQHRQDKIRRALPDMLDMLTISVQAGLGFDMALTKLVRNTSGPLSEEFARMLNEVQAGVSRRDALRHLGERTNVSELDNFIVSMVQADVFGVSVSGILHTQAIELRKKRRLRAEELAQKAPVQMVFPIICCILPATLVVILGPAAIAIGRMFGMGV